MAIVQRRNIHRWVLLSVWMELLQRRGQSSRPWAGRRLGPNEKVLGKSLSGNYYDSEEQIHISCRTVLSCGSTVKVVFDWDLSATSALRGWREKRFLWNFLNPRKENISLEMPYQPSPLPHFLTLMQLLQSQKELSVFIQKHVAQIWIQELQL